MDHALSITIASKFPASWTQAGQLRSGGNPLLPSQLDTRRKSSWLRNRGCDPGTGVRLRPGGSRSPPSVPGHGPCQRSWSKLKTPGSASRPPGSAQHLRPEAARARPTDVRPAGTAPRQLPDTLTQTAARAGGSPALTSSGGTVARDPAP